MIVLCTSCQAKFRIADEKIGPRGAKARCSRCQTVFAVHPELGAMPLPARVPAAPASRQAPPLPDPSPALEPPRAAPRVDLDLESSARAAPPAADPFADAPGPEADPFAAAAAAAPARDPDPFAWTLRAAPEARPSAAAAGEEGPHDPFQESADPFARAGGDPFAPDGARDGAPELADAAGADPFARPASAPEEPWDRRPDPGALLAQAAAFEEAPPPGGRGLPLTDVADLFGAGAAEGAPSTGPAAPPAGVDLTLEDRATPPAFRAPGAGLELPLGGLGGPEPAIDAGALLPSGGRGSALDFGPSGLDLAMADASPPEPSLAPDPSEGLALATDPAPARAARAPALPPPLPPPLPSAIADRAPGREARSAPAPAPAPPAPASRARSPRRSGLPALVVNALALAALVAVALAILVVWRGGRLDAAALHPVALVAALRQGPSGPFVAEHVRSGLYERERGAPLLFVRGDVVSRAPGPVRAVRVAVEIVREGTVVARGEALAGAVPSPEELWRAASPGELARVERRAASRAPERLGPGDALPFLVAIDEYPAGLAGAALRISAEEERSR